MKFWFCVTMSVLDGLAAIATQRPPFDEMLSALFILCSICFGFSALALYVEEH